MILLYEFCLQPQKKIYEHIPRHIWNEYNHTDPVNILYKYICIYCIYVPYNWCWADDGTRKTLLYTLGTIIILGTLYKHFCYMKIYLMTNFIINVGGTGKYVCKVSIYIWGFVIQLQQKLIGFIEHIRNYIIGYIIITIRLGFLSQLIFFFCRVLLNCWTVSGTVSGT